MDHRPPEEYCRRPSCCPGTWSLVVKSAGGNDFALLLFCCCKNEQLMAKLTSHGGFCCWKGVSKLFFGNFLMFRFPNAVCGHFGCGYWLRAVCNSTKALISAWMANRASFIGFKGEWVYLWISGGSSGCHSLVTSGAFSVCFRKCGWNRSSCVLWP